MGALFRSEEMSLCQFFIQTDATFWCLAELGEMGVVQFRDLNPDVNAFQRRFVNEVRRCDEFDRRLKYFESEIERFNKLDRVQRTGLKIELAPPTNVPDGLIAPSTREVLDLELRLERIERDLRDLSSNSETLSKQFNERSEIKHVLSRLSRFFDENDISLAPAPAGIPEVVSGFTSGLAAQLGAAHVQQINFLCGVIGVERLPYFERMIWRVCRGLVFLRYEEIDSPLQDLLTGERSRKAVFVVFYQGEQFGLRLRRICEGFHATLYPCPSNSEERLRMLADVQVRLDELNTVIAQSYEQRRSILDFAANHLRTWAIRIRKMKAIYHTLNLFATPTGSYALPAATGSLQQSTKQSGGGGNASNPSMTQSSTAPRCLVGEGWCPTRDLDAIRFALRRGTDKSGSHVPSILNQVPTRMTHPTFYRLNKFTRGFQNLVESYGIADYREVNPAPYTVITFPFLFAVMFGDAGHGLIMFLVALWMVMFERKLAATASKNEMFGMIFGGRYIILLMGIFSIYTGLIYNDVFSKALTIFPPGWSAKNISDETITSAIIGVEFKKIGLDPVKRNQFKQAYWFGLDPIWVNAENKLLFVNAIKMKMAIILGFAQMLFGLVLSLVNQIHFKRMVNIYGGWVPELLFLNSLIGYLIFIIFYKYIFFSPDNSKNAPSLLIGLINMIMFKYDDSLPINQQPTLFKGQRIIQSLLVPLAVVCIPWMLLTKPLIEMRKKKNAFRHQPLMNEINATLESVHSSYGSTTNPRVNLGAEGPMFQPTIESGFAGESGGQRVLVQPGGSFSSPASTPSGSPATSAARMDAARGLGANAPTDATSLDHAHSLALQPSYRTAPNTLLNPQSSDSSVNSQTELMGHQGGAGALPGDDGGEEEHEGGGDVFIHQAIHTIEYCLGCISNTASYLRLWALSLAHSQLSEVVWSFAMRAAGLGKPQWYWSLTIVLGFAAFAGVTVCVLIMMEGLSAFLHALRLHWVEFQNKFYKGTGIKFTPFAFKDYLVDIADANADDL